MKQCVYCWIIGLGIEAISKLENKWKLNIINNITEYFFVDTSKRGIVRDSIWCKQTVIQHANLEQRRNSALKLVNRKIEH